MCHLVYLAAHDKLHKERNELRKALFILQAEFKVNMKGSRHAKLKSRTVLGIFGLSN